MCVAIYKAPGLSLSREVLKQCFDKNPDGCGFAYVNSSGAVVVFKSMNFDEFADTYLPVQEQYVDSPMIVHFRIKTHGTKDIYNCHPFQVDENIVFIHNGIISKVPDCPEKKRSDTQMFNEYILKFLPEGWNENEAITDLIEEYIGYSKLVVLDRRTNAVKIYNEDKGTWKDGIWFSNMHWEETKRSVYKHADHCLQCQNWIANNVYANTNNLSFCSVKCKDTFSAKYYSWQRSTCEYCGDRNTSISTWRKGVNLEYCSQFCREKHFEVLEKEETRKVIPLIGYTNKSSDNKNPDLEECTWCDEMQLKDDMLEVNEYVHPYFVHKICVKCLCEAIDMGLIEESPELKALIEGAQSKQEVA